MEISLVQLIKMMRDASAGLVHLHSQAVCHRDLAARNLLVDDKLRVYVSDFGLSRALPTGVDAAKHTAGTALPIFWMAPESMKYQIYSVESDVYMFSITMWEMLERDMPYRGTPPLQIPSLVWKGERPRIIDDGAYVAWDHITTDTPVSKGGVSDDGAYANWDQNTTDAPVAKGER